ncbi:MAG TPA: EAL domain-containing protein [Solirubrobacteraceae bacterium]|jgi:diguanylate cyclase (GGDEF)-like protein/PAS domain S-box-containing protein|nr:EAL domain-containing protein [Solirubrobacteraceae bacterium]
MQGRTSEKDRDYKAIVESVPAILYIAETGEIGAWHYVNEWIEPILGFTVDEWTSDPGAWVRQLHPEDREKALAVEAEGVEQLTYRGQDQWGSFFLDYRMFHKDGRVVWIRDSSVLVRGADGTPLWHGMLMDISDQKEIEQQLERRSAAQAAVARLGEHALAGMPIAELLDEACRAGSDVLHCDAAVASQIGDNRNSLDLRAEYGWNTDQRLRHREGLERDSPSVHTLLTGKPLLIQNWDDETRFAATEPLRVHGVKSSIGVRIEGPVHPWGVFGVFSSQPDAFTEHDVDFVVSVANILADAIERQEAEDAMQHRALHDPLTGLPNRVLFTDRLEQALERVRRHSGSLAAILFIDVDHFKQVNDTLGHQAGDDLLVGVATRLREAVRPTDTVARFGGDEFGLLLEEIASERVAIATAERIAAGFARPFVLDAGSQFVTASIGIALADGHQDANALLRDADAAMYRAKQRGRARYDLFDEDLRVRALARGRIENDLRRAVEFHQLRLVYQPVVDLRDETMNAVEALLRWDHPQRGLVTPGEFIPVAEESGMIDRIGQWVIEEALRDAAGWERLRPDLPPLNVGLNVSVQQLQNPRFPETVSDAIQAVGIEPQNVALELDESVLRDEAEQIRSTLRLLKRIGVRLAVHDFGTGDSSLRQLAALPIDTIKVDRRFVAALGTEDATSQIAQAVIATGSALELNVIGAGAETSAQVEELRKLGCSSAQGFLFSQPVAAAEVASLVADGGSLKRTLT